MLDSTSSEEHFHSRRDRTVCTILIQVCWAVTEIHDIGKTRHSTHYLLPVVAVRMKFFTTYYSHFLLSGGLVHLMSVLCKC